MRRRLVPTLVEARAAIGSGRVLVGGAAAAKPSRLVDPGEPIRLLDPGPRFVSRGGNKLEAALERFLVEVDGKRVLDAGASTGGFTDCVLQRGAAQVIAVDVGRGQLHERVRRDRRVSILDRTNIRDLDEATIGGAVDMVVGDLSFISLRTVAGDLLRLCRPGGDLVLLVKPQFEAAHHETSRGRGVITDPEVWRRTVLEVGAALEGRGAAIMGVMVSPRRGAQGNVEFLIHALEGAVRRRPSELAALADAAVQAAVDQIVPGPTTLEGGAV